MTYASPFLLTTPGVVPTSTRGSWEPGHCRGLVWCCGFLLQMALVCCFMLFAPLTCFFWFDWHVVWDTLTVDDTCASRIFGRLSKVLHVFESGIEDVFIRSSETEQHVLGNFHYWKFTTYKTLGKWMWLDTEMKNLSVFWDTHRFHVRFFRLFSIVKQYLMACYSNVLFDSVISILNS